MPLRHAHRQIVQRASGWVIYWRYGRGAGSIPLATFRGATREAVEAAEDAGAEEIAAAWLAAHRPAPPTGTLRGLCAAFQDSPKFARMARSTQAEWRRSLSLIMAELGHLTRRQIEAPTATAILIDWRDSHARTPRKADYLVTVLRATLKHARQRGLLAATCDPCRDIDSLYRVDRSEVVWHPGEIEALCAAAQPDMARALRFLWLTGMRRGDAVTVRWDAIQDGAIVLKTGKTRHRQVVQITAELAALLAQIPRRATTILTGPDGSPYKPDSLTQGLLRALRRVRATQPDFAKGKRLHDLRGSRATEHVAQLVAEALADPTTREAMGWSQGRTAAPAHYVAPVTALATARRIRQRNTP